MRKEPLHAQPVLVIAGPTASGKSALALELCTYLSTQGTQAEILAVDSITVYRGFDIGAAKPSQADRTLVPHHLLDLANPQDTFTAADFARTAAPLIASMHDSGKVPVITGGTGFYLRALIQGMASDSEEVLADSLAIKKRLTEKARIEGWEKLYAELLAQDPGSARTVHANDHYRILRALQAMELHGEKWSLLNEKARNAVPKYAGLRYFCVQRSREELAQRVAGRTQKMLADGLLQEVRNLLASGVSTEAKALASVGYKECMDCLAGRLPESDLAAAIQHETMRLAKRQMTWFRGERNVEWIENLSDLKSALMLN